jgi:L,D-peptidoglycan transpeptidase YkuD (ErfK/YbiS/YcfS/YnhG family)
LFGRAGSLVNLSRRTFSSLLLGSCTALLEGCMPDRRYIDLRYSGGCLSWPDGATRAACGRGGVHANKREGDGASPAGTFPLLHGYYRADRVAAPDSGLAMTPLRPDDGWVDDPADPNYNRPVRLPYPGHHEELWLASGLYDIIVVIGYNTDPIVPGAGSAIFLHAARADFAPTDGCIAVAGPVVAGLLPLLGPGSTITIEP